MSKTVVRLDNIEGAKPVSTYYTSDGSTAAAIENGRFVFLSALKEGDREVWIAIAPADADNKNCKLETGRLAFVASPEFMTDERKLNLNEFENLAGDVSRSYLLEKGNIVSVTAEAFNTVPDNTNKYVTLYANGSTLMTGVASIVNNQIGEFLGTEEVGSLTYYVIAITGSYDA